MSSVDPEALRLIRELQANRASLSPAVGAKVDELVAKYIRPSAQMPTMPIPSPPPIERGLLDEAVGAVSQFWENINPMPQARTFAGHMQERYAQMPGTAVVSPFGHGGAAPGGTIPAIAAMGDTALDVAKGIGGMHAEQARKTYQKAQQGKYGEAIGHGLATLIPVLGPLSAEAGEMWQRGERGEALGQGAAMLAPLAIEAGGPLIARGAKAGAKAATRGVISSERAAQLSAENMARALDPTTVENRAMAQRVAPELARRGEVTGARGTTIDRNILTKADETEKRLRTVEDRLLAEERPEYKVHMEPLNAEVDGIIKSLERYPEINSSSITAMRNIRTAFSRLGRYADFRDVLGLRRALDGAIREAGGFKAAASSADRLQMRAQRGGAQILSDALKNLDPEYKTAVQDYSLYRSAADIVERRHLGEIGTRTNLPGAGSLLDDILAGWAGRAIGGEVGAAAFEAVNLARQSPGWALGKSRMFQRVSEFAKPPAPPPMTALGAGGPMYIRVGNQWIDAEDIARTQPKLWAEIKKDPRQFDFQTAEPSPPPDTSGPFRIPGQPTTWAEMPRKVAYTTDITPPSPPPQGLLEAPPLGGLVGPPPRRQIPAEAGGPYTPGTPQSLLEQARSRYLTELYERQLPLRESMQDRLRMLERFSRPELIPQPPPSTGEIINRPPPPAKPPAKKGKKK